MLLCLSEEAALLIALRVDEARGHREVGGRPLIAAAASFHPAVAHAAFNGRGRKTGQEVPRALQRVVSGSLGAHVQHQKFVPFGDPREQAVKAGLRNPRRRVAGGAAALAASAGLGLPPHGRGGVAGGHRQQGDAPRRVERQVVRRAPAPQRVRNRGRNMNGSASSPSRAASL